jgi:hypothetical protein
MQNKVDRRKALRKLAPPTPSHPSNCLAAMLPARNRRKPTEAACEGLTNSHDEGVLRAPVLTAVCDFGVPNAADCQCPDLLGRVCGEPGCHKKVHHLCLIEAGRSPNQLQKFVDLWPSSTCCRAHCVARVVAHEAASQSK